jgi:glycosyltransferase involved in cell wall biosynthesis
VRITIDNSAAFNQGAGIGRYARNVVPAALSRLLDVEAVLFYAPEPNSGARFIDNALAMFSPDARLRVRRAPFDRRRMDQIWFRARLPVPIELWSGRSDLVYSPDFTAPPALRAPTIVTVHDLAFEIVPERAPHALRSYLSAVVPRQVERSAAIVAVSETTKHDLVDRYGLSAECITVVPNAADNRFFEATALSPEERRTMGLPDRYLLTVGTIEPRKNHSTLFDALDLVPERLSIPLVIAGRAGWAADDIVARASKLQAMGRVMLLDYVDDPLLPRLYSSATAIVYPSWYEGFGLPVIEGLASGVPVIASDVPAHREVAGEHATFVSPGDAAEIANAIVQAISSGSSESAQVERQRSQARRYTWERSGQALAALFREVTGT